MSSKLWPIDKPKTRQTNGHTDGHIHNQHYQVVGCSFSSSKSVSVLALVAPLSHHHHPQQPHDGRYSSSEYRITWYLPVSIISASFINNIQVLCPCMYMEDYRSIYPSTCHILWLYLFLFLVSLLRQMLIIFSMLFDAFKHNLFRYNKTT